MKECIQNKDQKSHNYLHISNLISDLKNHNNWYYSNIKNSNYMNMKNNQNKPNKKLRFQKDSQITKNLRANIVIHIMPQSQCGVMKNPPNNKLNKLKKLKKLKKVKEKRQPYPRVIKIRELELQTVHKNKAEGGNRKQKEQ